MALCGQEKQDISDSSQIKYIPHTPSIAGTYLSLKPKKAIRDPWAGLLTSLHRRARLLSFRQWLLARGSTIQQRSCRRISLRSLSPSRAHPGTSDILFFVSHYTTRSRFCKGQVSHPSQQKFTGRAHHFFRNPLTKLRSPSIIYSVAWVWRSLVACLNGVPADRSQETDFAKLRVYGVFLMPSVLESSAK